MTLPALTTPAPQTDLRAEFWASRTRNREAEARLLWAAFLRWQLEPGNRDAPPWAFLVWLCEGQDASPGSLKSPSQTLEMLKYKCPGGACNTPERGAECAAQAAVYAP